MSIWWCDRTRRQTKTRRWSTGTLGQGVSSLDAPRDGRGGYKVSPRLVSATRIASTAVFIAAASACT